MALERYIAICKPLHHPQLCTVKRTYILIGLIWLLSSVPALTDIFIVLTHQLPHFPTKYLDLQEVVCKQKAQILTAHRLYDCTIDILPGTSSPKRHLFFLISTEKKAMEDYIQKAVALGVLRPSASTAGAGFFFVVEKEWRSSGYEYFVMPFGLMKVPAAFQHNHQQGPQDALDHYEFICFDNILIFSHTVDKHIEHCDLDHSPEIIIPSSRVMAPIQWELEDPFRGSLSLAFAFRVLEKLHGDWGTAEVCDQMGYTAPPSGPRPHEGFQSNALYSA
ncbi:hypothetical protein AOLI_G00013170 [Acnodon oligacanthus]